MVVMKCWGTKGVITAQLSCLRLLMEALERDLPHYTKRSRIPSEDWRLLLFTGGFFKSLLGYVRRFAGHVCGGRVSRARVT